MLFVLRVASAVYYKPAMAKLHSIGGLDIYRLNEPAKQLAARN